MQNVFVNKVILVTGGVGSIGSVIVETLLNKHSPNQVRIFDNNEEKLFYSSRQLRKYKNARFLMGDIRDKGRINWAMSNVDYVFHAAALKHVVLNEYNPFEAIKTNVLGTENVCLASIKQKVKKFINISTDKASIPTSTMGASKLLGERITSAANYYKGKSPTVCASVRFGNVIGSSGSVIPIFSQQIKKGGPITITDKRMVRYFMSINQAVSLIFKATKIAKGGEVFILKMPRLKIKDLAEVLIKELAPKYGHKPKEIKIKEIGRRPGEKIREKIITSVEKEFTLEMPKMFVIPPLVENIHRASTFVEEKLAYYHKLGAKSLDKKEIKKSKLLTKKEIKKILRKNKII